MQLCGSFLIYQTKAFNKLLIVQNAEAHVSTHSTCLSLFMINSTAVKMLLGGVTNVNETYEVR